MTSYVVGFCACLLIGGMGTYGFTVPADDAHKPPEPVGVTVVAHAVRTGVSGPFSVPYVAIDDRGPYAPRHAAWLKSPVGVSRHDGTGRVYKTIGDNRLESFYAQMRAYAA